MSNDKAAATWHPNHQPTRLLRWTVRTTLRALGHRLDKRVCRFPNETAGEDES